MASRDPLDQAADEIASEAPPSRDDAIEQIEGEARVAHEGYTDRQGRAFDPELHVTLPDGSPKLTRNGNLTIIPVKERPKQRSGQRRRGRPRGRPTKPTKPTKPEAVGSTLNVAGDADDNFPGPAPGSSRAAAVGVVGGIQAIGLTLGGEEWAYQRDERIGRDEESEGIDAFERWFESRGITDIPPGIGIAIWAASYAAMRLNKPKTKERARLGWQWAKVKLGGLFGRRGEAHARADSGDDGIGQDHARDPARSTLQGAGVEGRGARSDV